MAARGVLVVVIAALLGILILKNGFDSSASVDTGGSSATTTTPAATTTTIATTTTDREQGQLHRPRRQRVGHAGAAGRLTEKMQADGFTMAQPVTATTKVDTTKVYYLSGYEAAAGSVASYLAVGPPEPMPEPKPVADLGQAQVLVVEGRDIASSAATPQPTTHHDRHRTG